MLLDSIPDCTFHQKLEVKHCRQDSREVEKNDLFFALKGQKVDGHDFLCQVAKKGAIAAVVDVSYTGPDFGLALFRSENVLSSLQKLAKSELLKRKTKILAITGSLGKTTTKEFLAALIEDCGRVEKSPKSYNSQSTLPLNILNSSSQCEWLILEMGMSKALELSKLVNIASPYLALITKIAYVHAENFDSLQCIAQAKAEIFSKEKTAHRIACHQLLSLVKLKNSVKTFSMENSSADFFLKKLDKKWIFMAHQKEVFTFENLLFPEVLMENLLAALSCAYTLKFPMEKIKNNLQKLHPPPMRLQIIDKRNVQFINDAYNSNLDSLKAALSLLETMSGHKIAVLSEMRELGKFSKTCHEEIAYVALRIVDVLFCIGKEAKVIHDLFQKEKKESYYFEDKEKLMQALLPFLKAGDSVLVKGSRFWELETIIDKF